MKKPITILSLLMIFAVSCKTPQTVVKTEYKEITTETVRDSVVVIPPDSAYIQALLECDSVGNVLLKELTDYRAGRYIQPPQIKVVENVITVTAEVDSLLVYITWKERFKQAETKTTATETEQVKVRGPFWYIGLVFAAGAFLSVVIIIIRRKLGFKI